MNSEKRLEILEAFASSKPTEFDGFAIQWLREHPEPAVVPIYSEVKPDAEMFNKIAVEDLPKKKRTRRAVQVTESESEVTPLAQTATAE